MIEFFLYSLPNAVFNIEVVQRGGGVGHTVVGIPETMYGEKSKLA